jgi:hypothetical protein
VSERADISVSTLLRENNKRKMKKS